MSALWPKSILLTSSLLNKNRIWTSPSPRGILPVSYSGVSEEGPGSVALLLLWVSQCSGKIPRGWNWVLRVGEKGQRPQLPSAALPLAIHVLVLLLITLHSWWSQKDTVQSGPWLAVSYVVAFVGGCLVWELVLAIFCRQLCLPACPLSIRSCAAWLPWSCFFGPAGGLWKELQLLWKRAGETTLTALGRSGIKGALC